MSPMSAALVGFLVICIGTAGVLAAATVLYRSLAGSFQGGRAPRTALAGRDRTDNAARRAGTPAWQALAAQVRAHAAVPWRPAWRRRAHP